MATAKAYLQSRGLDLDKIPGEAWAQGGRNLQINGVKVVWPTVGFILPKNGSGSGCHRLIDWQGKDKNRMQGKFAGQVWLPQPLPQIPPCFPQKRMV